MLCGLQRPVKNYDPSTYENELYLISKRSKGYRKGFENDYEPILGDDVYTPLIKNRILEIVRSFVERGIISDYELGGIGFKREEKSSFLDEVVKSALFKAFTGARAARTNNYIIESELKELTEYVDKLEADYYNLGDEYMNLIQNYLDKNKDYDKLVLKDLLNYALIHFLKYCDADIGGFDLNDFNIFLKTLDNDTMILLGCLYQGLSVEEWCRLMDRIQGTPEVQMFLNYFTMLKRAETNMVYNKFQLFDNLMMFRILKLSSSH